MSQSRKHSFIQALQGVRACAFSGIFLNHSVGGAACLGAAGVSVFFVLSGFLMANSYWDVQPVVSDSGVWGSLRFAWEKIRKLYPLHICMMICAIAYDVLLGRIQAGMIPQLIGKTGLHILCLQAWVPASEYYFSLNAVSWYLSAALFSYFIFPWLFRFLRRVSSRSVLFAVMGVLILIMAIISAIAAICGNQADQAWFSQHWITYVFPVSRAIDFALGATAGCLFVRRNDLSPRPMAESGDNVQKPHFAGTFVECCAVLLFVAAVIAFRFTPSWLRYSAIFAIPSLFLIVAFAQEKGMISRLLSLPPLQFVGSISGYAFLIHLFTIRAVVIIMQHAIPTATGLIIVPLSYAVTLIVSATSRYLFARVELFWIRQREP